MPRIELIPEVYYQPLDPYHHEYDNLPLKNILQRQSLINSAVDNQQEILTDAIGTQGTLSNRLAQSLEQDGSLIDTAIDETLHSIAEHTDTTKVVSSDVLSYFNSLGYTEITNPVFYVRMTENERNKLAQISEDATALKIQMDLNPSTTVLFEDETLVLEDTDTVSFEFESPNKIKANTIFPAAAAHLHYYDMTPVDDNIVTPDYTNYKTTSLATPFINGTLRVYVNGSRLSETDSIYVPSSTGFDSAMLLSYTPDYVNGTFELSAAITSDDIIRIDFDTQY